MLSTGRTATDQGQRRDTPSRSQLLIRTICRPHGGNAIEAISNVTAPPRGIISPSSESFPVNWRSVAGHTPNKAPNRAERHSLRQAYPSRYSFTKSLGVQVFSRVRRSTRRILPEIVLGSSANSIRRMRWYGARLRRTWAKIASAVARSFAHPGAKLMYALGTASRVGSGAGTTAASATAGCSMSTLSSSNGEIL
jgi:hypothetical protein